MSFKPEFLEKIGIKVDSVPEGLTVAFTDENRSKFKIEAPDKDPAFVDIRTRIYGEKAVRQTLADTLVSFGAERVSAPLPPTLGSAGC